MEQRRVLSAGRDSACRGYRPLTLDHATLRARLAVPATHAEPELTDDAETGWLPPPDAPLVPAAVLIPILTVPRPAILLTRRAATLAKHAGQVSFPGGRIDPDDADAEAAALREAQEEIALDPAQVELFGRMPDHVTGTGYIITPVLGFLPACPLEALGLCPAPDEVESLFALDLAVLLDPACPERREAEFRGRMRSFWVVPHPDHYIWGATAAILRQVALRLRRA